MGLWRAVLFAAIIVQVVQSASIFPCPESCKCTPEAGNYDRILLNCTTTTFLAKLKPKQASAIVKLDMVGLGLTKIDPRLKQLKRLESLNLSHNNLSSLVEFPVLPNLESLNLKANSLDDIMTGLPKGLKHVDVSSNNIHHITKQWTAFKKLSTVNFNDNPINCSCDTLLHFHQLTETLVQIDDLLTCQSPKAFKGKYIRSVNCSMVTEDLLNTLMGDSPSDASLDVHDENTEDPDFDGDEEFLTTDETVMDENNEGVTEEEGSGDEGSGAEPPAITEIEEETPKACYINCSTPKPLGLDDEANASPPPSLKETQDILIQDLFGDIKESSDPREEKVPPPEEIPIVEIGKRPLSTGKNAPQKEGSTVEMVQTKENITGEMERAIMGGQKAEGNSMTYYILGGLLAVFVALILIVTLRKRQVKNKKRPRSRKPQNGVQENGHMEEMKPLKPNGRSLPVSIENEKTKEEMPLVDGAHAAQDGEPNQEDSEDMTGNPWMQKDTLKVTIKASEIPDSVPRTPTFVQRRRDAEGNYTTTPQSSP